MQNIHNISNVNMHLGCIFTWNSGGWDWLSAACVMDETEYTSWLMAEERVTETAVADSGIALPASCGVTRTSNKKTVSPANNSAVILLNIIFVMLVELRKIKLS